MRKSKVEKIVYKFEYTDKHGYLARPDIRWANLCRTYGHVWPRKNGPRGEFRRSLLSWLTGYDRCNVCGTTRWYR